MIRRRTFGVWPLTELASRYAMAGVIDAEPAGRKFYVDAEAGCDLNTGLSPDNAWRSIGRLSSAVFLPKDTVHLRRGQLFAVRESVRLRPANRKVRDRTEDAVRLIPYGPLSEARPILSCWVTVPPQCIEKTGATTWLINVLNIVDRPSDPIVASNIGQLRIGQTVSLERLQRRALKTSSFGFLCLANGLVELHAPSDFNPANTEVAIAPNIKMFGADAGIHLSDLTLEGTGGNCADLLSYSRIEWCLIRHVGGSVMGDGRRYGNGVQIFAGGRSIYVNHNFISHCFDCGLTIQGYGDVKSPAWFDIDLSDNWIVGCAQGFEVWAWRRRSPVATESFEDVVFDQVRVLRLRLFFIGASWTRIGRWGYDYYGALFVPSFIQSTDSIIRFSIAEMQGCTCPVLFFPREVLNAGALDCFHFERSSLSLPANVRVAHGFRQLPADWAELATTLGLPPYVSMLIEPPKALAFAGDSSFEFDSVELAQLYDRWLTFGMRTRNTSAAIA